MNLASLFSTTWITVNQVGTGHEGQYCTLRHFANQNVIFAFLTPSDRISHPEFVEPGLRFGFTRTEARTLSLPSSQSTGPNPKSGNGNIVSIRDNA
jgi:hypothetical protein